MAYYHTTRNAVWTNDVTSLAHTAFYLLTYLLTYVQKNNNN